MRPDYCPIGGEPCQSLCNEPCTRTPQRTWVGLTVDEIETIWRKVEAGDFHDCVLPFAEKLEAKLKQNNGYAEEKNT